MDDWQLFRCIKCGNYVWDGAVKDGQFYCPEHAPERVYHFYTHPPQVSEGPVPKIKPDFVVQSVTPLGQADPLIPSPFSQSETPPTGYQLTAGQAIAVGFFLAFLIAICVGLLLS